MKGGERGKKTLKIDSADSGRKDVTPKHCGSDVHKRGVRLQPIRLITFGLIAAQQKWSSLLTLGTP